jgi:hypothetical protein
MVRNVAGWAQLSIEERTDWVRLDWNENPYPLRPSVRNAVHAVSFLMNEYAPLDQSRVFATSCARISAAREAREHRAVSAARAARWAMLSERSLKRTRWAGARRDGRSRIGTFLPT